VKNGPLSRSEVPCCYRLVGLCALLLGAPWLLAIPVRRRKLRYLCLAPCLCSLQGFQAMADAAPFGPVTLADHVPDVLLQTSAV